MIVAPQPADFTALLVHPAASRVERLARETPARFVVFDVLAGGDDDRSMAEDWLDLRRAGIDGVVAKHRDLRYELGRPSMVKVKRERSADCVVAGFRLAVDRPVVASLLLGLYGETGELRHIGVVSSFTAAQMDPAPV